MFSELPFPAWYAVLLAASLVRANATYWAGRGARNGGEHTRAARLLATSTVRRAETLVARFGAPAVALGFLTVGVQTAINLSAGVLRMPLWRYEIAALIGSLAWAGIYSTVGFAVFEAWFGEAPWRWGLLLLAGLAVLAISTVVVKRRLEVTPEASENLVPQPPAAG